MNKADGNAWAQAIAIRIADEWSGKIDFPDDKELLTSVLRRCFQNSPSICEELIGTGIIEEDYFVDKL
jgi:hypothetical protein